MLNWSVESAKSKNHKILLKSHKPETKEEDKVNTEEYFDQARLVLFNKSQGERNNEEDPIIFSQLKVEGFLVSNPLN